MPWKEKFKVIHSSPRNERHTMPGRAIGGSTRAGHEAEKERRGMGQGFPWERQDTAEETA